MWSERICILKVVIIGTLSSFELDSTSYHIRKFIETTSLAWLRLNIITNSSYKSLNTYPRRVESMSTDNVEISSQYQNLMTMIISEKSGESWWGETKVVQKISRYLSYMREINAHAQCWYLSSILTHSHSLTFAPPLLYKHWKLYKNYQQSLILRLYWWRRIHNKKIFLNRLEFLIW